MAEPQESAAHISGPLVNVLLVGLKKVTGSSYEQLLEATPWRRYLHHPPSSNPGVSESNDEELSLVFAHIYKKVGADLFIAFGRYAGLEGGRTFAGILGPAVAPQLVGLTGVARLQRLIEAGVELVPWAFPLKVSKTPDGVELVNPNCGMCSRITSTEPVCTFLGDGLRHTYTQIMGEPVMVKEVVCRARDKGSNCVFKATLLGK